MAAQKGSVGTSGSGAGPKGAHGSGKQDGKGYGPPGGWPSTTGNKSGGNRGNASPAKS